MPPKKTGVSYISLRNEIMQRKFRHIYVLEGEEPYYIDSLTDLIVANALSDDERDFNLTVAYGADANINDLIGACRRYPVMAQRQVVVLKDAQNAGKSSATGNLDSFKFYAQRPLDTTILVICYKGGALKAKGFLDELKSSKAGVVFESSKVRDYELPGVIASHVKNLGLSIDNKSATMLATSIGTDLSRLFGEIAKLQMLTGPDKRISPELVEKNIGISKDYNNFELEDALIARNGAKAYRIIDYYEKNPKHNPVAITVSQLFSFFSSVLLLRTSKDHSDEGLMKQCNCKSAFRLKKFKEAAQRYSTLSCVNIISYLRECDTKSKGHGSRQDGYALLKELIFKILHA